MKREQWHEKSGDFAISEEDLAHAALSLTGIGVWSFDPHNSESRWSPEMFGLFGVPAVLGPVPVDHYLVRIHPADRWSWGAAMLECARMGQAARHRFRVVREDGSQRWIEAIANVQEKPQGRGRWVVGIAQDITAVIDSDVRADLALQILNCGTFRWSLKTNALEWDPANYAIFGVNPSEFSGAFEAWQALVLPEDLQAAKDAIQKSLEGGAEFNQTFRIKRPDGQTRYIGGRAIVLRGAENQPLMMIGVNWDRTAEVEDLRRRSEERSQALHLARLASLGEMAAGVAHEINNPLAILLGSVEALRTRGAKDPEFLERKLKAMEQATSRISQIVKGLQRYTRAKSHSAGHELLGLGKAVEEAVRFCARRAERASVSVHVNVTGSPQIRGESAEIEQMLINLLANGIDAAQGQARRDVWIESGLDGNEVVVRVRDTGPGLAPELAEKIFDPFFTTKAPGSGSGLGLSISRGIAESHGGTIRFVPGEPLTTFEIRLPRGETQRAIGSGSAA